MARREFTGEGNAPQRNPGWNPDELHVHVRGRAESTIRILVIGAALRSRRLLSSEAAEAISVTGAKWQDWSGKGDQKRAHRFPCNPQIGGWDLPLLVPPGHFRLAIKKVLGETDELPFHVNYVDRLFEIRGGIESARKGLGKVLLLQRPDVPVDHSIIVSAWKSVLSGYMQAWKSVSRELSDRVNEERAGAFLKRVAGFRRSAPTDNLETVIDVADEARRSTDLISQPAILSSHGIDAYLRELAVSGEARAEDRGSGAISDAIKE